jgi:carbamoyl-phosphate synthase large subunit
VLVNSNPATIMTDPEMADRTYIEPITWEYVAKIIEVERPDALLPTLGGQTGLNTAMDLVRHGVLAKYGVEMLGARVDVIKKAEERDAFKQAMLKIGLEVCNSRIVHNMDEARQALEEIGLPMIIRASFTLGGVVVSRTIAKNSKKRFARAWSCLRSTRCCSTKASSGGKSTRWR